MEQHESPDERSGNGAAVLQQGQDCVTGIHAVKEKIAVDKGYRVVYIWENEMRSLSDTELEKLLIERLSV